MYVLICEFTLVCIGIGGILVYNVILTTLIRELGFKGLLGKLFGSKIIMSIINKYGGYEGGEGLEVVNFFFHNSQSSCLYQYNIIYEGFYFSFKS